MNATLRVLLVDDDETSFILLERLLSKVPQKSFATDWAASYEAGLRTLSENRHDVCLLDYRLGPRTGLELLREAVAQGVQTPIIILTRRTTRKSICKPPNWARRTSFSKTNWIRSCSSGSSAIPCNMPPRSRRCKKAMNAFACSSSAAWMPF